MISSMTGFGRGEAKQNGLHISVEMRSLNHRFLDVDVRLPKHLASLDYDLKELVGARLHRGRVNVAVAVKGEQTSDISPRIDLQLAEKYVQALEQARETLHINGAIHLEHLLNLPDVITFETSDDVEEPVREAVHRATEQAIAELQSMRQREGVEIRKDLTERVQNMDAVISAIEKRSREKSSEVHQQLRQKVKEIVAESQLDEQRLAMEVAMLTEKMDVTEECIRFKSHNTLFLELLEHEESQGRRLNFLLQEMHREANTIGAKASDAQIAHWVVDIKEEVEKLREQIQNIE